MTAFDPAKRLAEARALLDQARAAPPHQHNPPKGGKGPKYARHNLAHDAIVLLIGPLCYTEHKDSLTEQERADYEALLAAAKGVRGY